MIKKLRVAVDHGNRNMKTCNFVFTTGLTEQDKKPARGEKYLKYQGKYYTLSEKRIPYQRVRKEIFACSARLFCERLRRRRSSLTASPNNFFTIYITSLNAYILS